MPVTDLLYQWPSAARFGRRVPKEKFYEHASVTHELLVSLGARPWQADFLEPAINEALAEA